MMLNKGKFQGQQILSRESVAEMTRDQLSPRAKTPTGYFGSPWGDRGWGFGVLTRKQSYGWDGGYGTTWANSPSQDLVAILMTQRSQFPAVSEVYLDFWKSVDRLTL
jgi:CubicO group peptidase (beta-lactamase class C family)